MQIRFLSLFLAVASLLAGCGPKTTKAPPPLEAGYVVMTTQSASLNVELAGRTAAYETSDVRPQVTGLIKARHFVEGSIVQAGQTLYEIDPSLYRAAVAQAQANLEFAEASRDAAVVKAARFKPLAALQAVAQQDYADAEAAAKQSIASVAQNRAALETARINLAYTRVPAPITGRIGRSVATTGALATVGQTDPLTTIQRLDPIFVDIQQSSADLVSLQRSLAAGGVTPSSTEVRLILEDGSQYPIVGKLEFSDPMVDQNTGSVTLRARFANPSALLLPGMYVRAKLSQATAQNVILAPQQGVSRDPRGNATVKLIGPDSKVVTRTITTDRTVGNSWLVTSGLKPGDRVIVEGVDRVKSGQVVRPVPAGSPSGPPNRGAAK